MIYYMLEAELTAVVSKKWMSALIRVLSELPFVYFIFQAFNMDMSTLHLYYTLVQLLVNCCRSNTSLANSGVSLLNQKTVWIVVFDEFNISQSFSSANNSVILCLTRLLSELFNCEDAKMWSCLGIKNRHQCWIAKQVPRPLHFHKCTGEGLRH